MLSKWKLFKDECPEWKAYNYEGKVRNIPDSGENNGIRTDVKEYTELKLLLTDLPVKDEPDTWNRICEKLACFKTRDLSQQYFKELSVYAIRNYPKQYAVNFENFLKIVGSVSFVTEACEELLREHHPKEAMNAAKPCMDYLKNRSDIYTEGRLCFSSMEEAILYAAERSDSGERKADDNYTGFFLCYARILLSRDPLYSRLQEDEKLEIARCLDHAEKMSPCNASLWELKSRIYRESDQRKYMDCIRKALLYSIQDDANHVLGDVYANLAAYHSAANFALADALCVLSAKYGADPSPVKFILSGYRYDSYPDAELAVHQAGIQVGYSSLARMAMEKAIAYRGTVGVRDTEDSNRKMILLAADSAYRYEVRDPMTIIGRSSAMSEFLKMKPTVSRIHARLIKENDQLFVADMEAMNGTYVNGIRIGRHRQVLHEGDELRLGSASGRGARFILKKMQ